MTFHCFLSYASSDLAYAQRVCDTLTAAGLNVWFDKLHLRDRDGVQWQREIEKGCRESRVIVPILTPRWKQSEWTRYETYGAESIVPLVMEGTWEEVSTPPLLAWQSHTIHGPLCDAQLIEGLLRKDQPKKSQRIAHMRHLANPFFVGREDLLIHLHETMFTAPTTVLNQGHIVAVTALGGMGKTALARHYAERFWRCYRHLFWVDCRLSLESEFAKIHDILRPNLYKLQEADKAAWVKHELSQDHRPLCLLVLDNAENEQAVRDWLPNTGKSHILITSRFTAWSPGVKTCPVDILPLHAATKLLLRNRSHDQAVEEVALKLGCLPLALEHASAYVERESLGFGEYLDLYLRHEEELLQQPVSSSTDYPSSVYLTWRTTMNRLSAGARALLRLHAFFAPTPLPMEVWLASNSKLASLLNMPETPSEITIRNWVEELTSYSMIQRQSAGLCMHVLVQSVVRFGACDLEFFLKNATSMLMGYLPPRAQTWSSREIWKQAQPHAAALWNRSQSPEPLFSYAYGSFLLSQGSYMSAAGPLTSALSALSRRSKDHVDTLNAATAVAELFRSTGSLKRAEDLHLKTLSTAKRMHGWVHKLTLHSATCLARVYLARENYLKAENLCEETIEAKAKVFRTADLSMLESRKILAQVYLKEERYERAEAVLLELGRIAEESLPSGHPFALGVMNDLGLVYQDQGFLDDAMDIFQSLLRKATVALGPQHPNTLEAMSNLARSFFIAKQFNAAKELSLKVLDLRREVLGNCHYSTLRSMNNLAETLEMLHETSQALELYRNASLGLRKLLGSKHGATKKVAANYHQLQQRIAQP